MYSPSPPVRPRNGFGGARTLKSSARSSSYKPRKPEASANAPWTRTTVGGPLPDMRIPFLNTATPRCATARQAIDIRPIASKARGSLAAAHSRRHAFSHLPGVPGTESYLYGHLRNISFETLRKVARTLDIALGSHGI